MKKQLFGKVLTARLMALLFTVFSATLILSGCSEDDPEPPVAAAPTISLSPASTTAIPGQAAGTQVTLNAPAGLKTLRILVNGSPSSQFPNQNLEGTSTTSTYDLNFTVPESAIPGNAINFTFILVDQLDRSTEPAAFSINVTEIPPKPLVQVGGVNALPGYSEHIKGVAVDGIEGTYLEARNVNFTKDKIYVLIGFVRVGPIPGQGTTPQTDDGRTEGVLNIEEGTVIVGDETSKGTLVIQRGGKLNAIGTAAEPIVFTSEKAPGERTPGDWGGLVICGRAKNNEGPHVQLEGGYAAWHGGDDDDDNSGTLKYVRIEWAGIPINPNEEVNTLTMGSVGRGTVIEYVQASFGLDDQFEWFGGSVDGRYLIAYRGLDDDFDVDLGHSGNVQFGIGIRDAKDADQSGSNGFEVDNNGSGALRQPFTSTVFSNITIIGPKKTRETSISAEFQHAAQLRRSSKIKIYNSVLTGYPMGIFIDGVGSTNSAVNDSLQLRNVVLAGVEGWGGNGFGKAYDTQRAFGHASSLAAANYPDPNIEGLPFVDGNNNPRGNHPGSEPRGHAMRWTEASFNAIEWFNTEAYNNKFVVAWNQTGIDGSVFDRGTPSFLIPQGSMLATGAKWDNTPFVASNPKSSWFGSFEQVSFIGAFGTSGDWTQGWANFSINTDYGISR
jgi:hypothetical protein